MFAFRSAIRKLFGIIIPGVDKTEVDVVAELRAALDEAEAEIDSLTTTLVLRNIEYALNKVEVLNAIGTLMVAFDINSIELSQDEDAEDEE